LSFVATRAAISPLPRVCAMVFTFLVLMEEASSFTV
jgi:hypothetical protein